jgi:hypothetical protein
MYQKTSTARKPYARKNASPQQQLNAAIDRAQANNVTVAGAGTFADGRRFWLVASQSVQGMHHVVSQHGKSLECDCIYSQMQHKVCVHRAAVYLFLRDQAVQAASEARAAAQPAPAPASQEAVETPCATVAKPQPATSARASLSEKERRETAILAVDDAPFSIYKTERRYQTLEDEYASRDGAPSSDHYQHAYR